MPVDTPGSDYAAMLPKWERCRATADGEDAIKNGGEKYLPNPFRDPNGNLDRQRYEEYKARADFFPAMGRTIVGLGGAVMQKPPTLELPPLIQDDAKDIDLAGTSLEMATLESLEEVLTTGRYGVLVEMPAEDAMDQRPYWCFYRAEDILSVRTERRGGDEVVTRVVLREKAEEPDPKDAFVMKCVEQYRVLELGETYTQTIYRKNEAGDWVAMRPEGQEYAAITPLRRGKPLTFIPFVFLGPTGTSAEIVKPPLLDLANKNLSHYRNVADLEDGLHHVGVPVLVVIGANPDNSPMSYGSGVAIKLPLQGDAKLIQADGETLGALERVAERKRKEMSALGARLLEEQTTSAETATAVSMRHSGEHATLRTIAQAVEQGLTMALRFHGWWVGAEAEPTDVKASIELNKEFFVLRMTPAEAKDLVTMWQAEGMSWATVYYNLQRGGLAREGVSADDERAEIERESPPPPEPDPAAADPNAPPADPMMAGDPMMQMPGMKPGQKPPPGMKPSMKPGGPMPKGGM